MANINYKQVLACKQNGINLSTLVKMFLNQAFSIFLCMFFILELVLFFSVLISPV